MTDEDFALVEKVAREMVIAVSSHLSPDCMVMKGELERGPKNSVIIHQHLLVPLWKLYQTEAWCAINLIRYGRGWRG